MRWLPPVVLLVLLASPALGRAVPTGNYRPPLPPDALVTGCFPLPGGAQVRLPHQVRSDRTVLTPRGARRLLHGQYDLVGRAQAEDRIVGAFVRVGFHRTARPAGPAGPAGSVRLAGPGGARVGIRVAPIPGTGSSTLVRGDFWLDLPVAARARRDDVCTNPASTKRWTS